MDKTYYTIKEIEQMLPEYVNISYITYENDYIIIWLNRGHDIGRMGQIKVKIHNF